MTDTAYPVDAGIIRCICGFDHDDTFTIQCEQCNVWQHAVCVGIESEKAVPDIYLCDRCGHNKHNVDAAVEAQTRFLRKKKRQGSKRVPESPSESEPPRRRGKKKRAVSSAGGSILSTENINDTAAACFVVCEQSEFTTAAQQVLKSISETSRSYTTDEFERLKPVSLSIQRNSTVYGPCGFKVVANQSITRGKLVCELKGEVLTFDEYVSQPWNQYNLWQCPKPGVLRVSGLPLLVDGRCMGTILSLVRRNSLPNILIEPFLVNNEPRFGAFARTSIRAGQELTVSWMWDSEFPLNQDTKATQFSALMDSLSKEEKAVVCNSLKELKSIGLIDTFSDCFAQTPSKTTLAALPKKAEEKKTMPLGRSVRKQLLLNLAAGIADEVAEPLEAVYEQDIWVLPKLEAQPTPEQEPRKKKLSLAEYKKKRPSMSVTPAGV